MLLGPEVALRCPAVDARSGSWGNLRKDGQLALALEEPFQNREHDRGEASAGVVEQVRDELRQGSNRHAGAPLESSGIIPEGLTFAVSEVDVARGERFAIDHHRETQDLGCDERRLPVRHRLCFDTPAVHEQRPDLPQPPTRCHSRIAVAGQMLDDQVT